MAAVTTHSVQNSLLRLSEALPDLVVIGESVGKHGMDRPSSGLGERAWSFPIADRGNVAVGLGRAVAGMPTVVVLADASRLAASFEVFADAARFRRGLDGDQANVPLVVRVPCDTDDQLMALGAMLALNPPAADAHLRVVACASMASADLIADAFKTGCPTIVLEFAGGHRSERPAEDVSCLREGQHVTLVGLGDLDPLSAAADRLAQQGVEADVLGWSLLSRKPALVMERVRQTGRLIAVGPASFRAVLEKHVLADAFLYLESPFGGCRAQADAITAAALDSVNY